MSDDRAHTLVLDVGKTNVKLAVADAEGTVVHRAGADNLVATGGPYPHVDVGGLWDWFLDACRETETIREVGALVVTTHGAAAALVDPDTGGGGLVLPVLDYEFDGVRESDRRYADVRPGFAESLSPDLPAGLNLGRQLFWLQQRFPREFDRARWIVPLPQYFAWRLCGVAAAEVTSLGCHTDLWAPRRRSWSSLVQRCDWQVRFPHVRAAGETLGTVTPSVSTASGLARGCRVLCGIHDSNAAYLRFIDTAAGPLTAISTGTWAVTMSPETPLDTLNPERDMLANVDVHGRPVACARFMGGRETERLCERTGASVADPYDIADLASVVAGDVFALPDFSGGSGPFGGRAGRVIGRPASGRALAALYAALMLDFELDLLEVTTPVVVEGSWVGDPLLAPLLAACNPRRRIHTVAPGDGILAGCLQLAGVAAAPLSWALQTVAPLTLPGLATYRDRWRGKLAGGAAGG